MHAPIKYRICRRIRMQSKLWFSMMWCDFADDALPAHPMCVASAQPLCFGAHQNENLFCIRPVYLPTYAQRSAEEWYSISLNMRTQVDTRRISIENDSRRSAVVA